MVNVVSSLSHLTGSDVGISVGELSLKVLLEHRGDKVQSRAGRSDSAATPHHVQKQELRVGKGGGPLSSYE